MGRTRQQHFPSRLIFTHPLFACSPDERSDIRDGDFAALSPGYLGYKK
jgi:hypothetical protein